MSMEGDKMTEIGALLEGWEVVRLGDIAKMIMVQKYNEPQISRNFGLRSVGVCFAYPLFDKPFSKVFIREICVLIQAPHIYYSLIIKSPAPICSRSNHSRVMHTAISI